MAEASRWRLKHPQSLRIWAPRSVSLAVEWPYTIVGKVRAGRRAELANSYLKDFNNNPELVFAGRCLDWNGGKLLLPEGLRPYMSNGEALIEHDRLIFRKALDPHLRMNAMDEDPRIQIYRTSMDSFLTWMCLVSSALDRRLFSVDDIHDVGYWVAKIQSEVDLHGFIAGYGYKEQIEKLIHRFRQGKSPYQNLVFPANYVASRRDRSFSENEPSGPPSSG